MKWHATLATMAVLGVLMCFGCASSTPNVTRLAGPAEAGPVEKPMMLVKVEKGLFGGKFEARITGGSVKADKITASTSQPDGKFLQIENPDLGTDNFIDLTDAASRQMGAILPLYMEFRALQKQYGENTTNIIDASAGLATAILNGLPAGQIRQACDHLVDVIAASRAAQTTQPAAKSEAPTVPAQ